ncbi:IPT/TIG domain-containing protein [Phocaeicola coprocola]|uniref:IPT/TIG domain-containing protein n=1 Tax=Phocaeicola coprocola TaxID=310298 RepID=UPI002943DC06|nr:IPT/TIG domain-containing protein [Phocaeicola coprocola]
MKTNRLSVLCLAGALLLTGVSFISCLKGDDVDTNQYVGGISLNVFGPSPVARGGELRFLGSGMNQVTAVVIPGCADITDINVISDREIRITVPQEAQPGLVTLRTPNGDITTRTELTFTEPISIENFKPSTVLPGDELTIEGEYLNLIHEVIFADEVTVTEEDFITHERNMIKLLVPEEAQTGQIILSDGEELPNLIYSEEDLVVILPSVEAVVNKENAKPGDVIEINGENLDLVRQMLMPDGTEVEFTVTSPTAIEFILPENASDGDVVVVPASGVKVTVAHLTMAVPTNLVATPASGLRGGDEIVLTGLNLDLVTSLSFPGVAENVQPASLSEKELTVVMPEAAQSGSLILNTKSGKQVSIVIETLKPLVGSYNPSSIPAGESLLINGQNLDLVASVTFGGGQTVAVSSSSASQLSVSVPMEAEAGNIVLNMYNGETVEAPSLTVTKPQCCYVMNLPEKVDAGALLELEVANGDKLTQVNVNGSQVQFILRDSKLMISLPAETVGEATLELVSSNGSISYQIEIVGSMGTLIYEGPLATGSWANSAQISSNMFATAQVGQVITVVVSDLQAGAQGSFKNSSWAAIAPGTEYFNIDGNFSLTITQDILTQLQSGGLIISGKNYTIESVYIK